MVYFNSINFYKQIRKGADVITVIDEATLVLDMDKLLAKYAIKEIQGVKIDLRRIKDKRYFVKKAYQIITNPNRPTDSDSFQGRTNLVRCLEYMLKTQFRNTRDFKEKCKDFLANTRTKEETENITRSAGKRIMRARKKLKWTQGRLAKELGFKSRKTIQRYENESMYPSAKVSNWLNKVEK
jgi:DNA-binding XRE family transcriptional regulator